MNQINKLKILINNANYTYIHIKTKNLLFIQNMNLIKQVIEQRINQQLNLISNASVDETYDQLKAKQQLLLRQKKNESVREVKQIHYLQILSSQKFAKQSYIRQFQELSKYLMSHYDSKFIEQIIESEDIINDSVFLYIKFFNDRDCSSKAYEILNIYNKRLCENQVLLPTLLSWFMQWSRKKYKQTLKIAIKNVNQQLGKYPHTTRENLMKSQINQTKTIINDHDVQSYYTSPLITSNSTQQQNLNINKQIVIGSLIQELVDIYKFHSGVLLDLDRDYLRSSKKLSYKNLIVNNIQKIAVIIINSVNQNQKQSIDRYKIQYCNKFSDYQVVYNSLKKVNKQRNDKIKQNNKLESKDAILTKRTKRVSPIPPNSPRISYQRQNLQNFPSSKAKQINFQYSNIKLDEVQNKLHKLIQNSPITNLHEQEYEDISEKIPKKLNTISKQQYKNQYVSLNPNPKEQTRNFSIKKSRMINLRNILGEVSTLKVGTSQSNIIYLPKIKKHLIYSQ